jgi:hypothetical protein
LIFTAGSTVKISNGSLRLDNCSTDNNQFSNCP